MVKITLELCVLQQQQTAQHCMYVSVCVLFHVTSDLQNKGIQDVQVCTCFDILRVTTLELEYM